MKNSKSISVFKDFQTKEGDYGLLETLDIIKTGNNNRSIILEIRDNVKRGVQIDELKNQLGSFTPSGTFHPTPEASNLQHYAGLILIEMERLGERKVHSIKKLAEKDLYTRAAFISPSGIGLKILVEVDTEADLHEVAFTQVANYYQNLLQVKMDRSGDGISKLCSLSYDPDLFFNQESNIFKVVDAFYGMYQSAVSKTMVSHKYQESEQNEFVSFLSRNCKDMEIPQKIAEKLILNDYNYDQEEVRNTINSSYKSVQKIDKEKESAWSKLEGFLRMNYDFLYNEMSGVIEYRKRPETKYTRLTDYEGNSIIRDLHLHGKRISKNRLFTILESDFVRKYHPLRDYIEQHGAWDGKTDYIAELARRVSTDDDEIFQDAFKRWFVAMVATGLYDDVLNHTAIIFTGKQGIGKSTFFRNLLPEELREYSFAGMIDPRNKDTLLHLTECLIIDMDELSSLTRKGNNEIKELITKDHVRLRKAFGRQTTSLPRRASFVGSVNEGQFLTDTTGNRRFLCFEVSRIDYKSPVNYEGVYAQAVALFHSDYKYYFDGEEIEFLNERAEKFRQKSYIEELVSSKFLPAVNKYQADHYLAAADFLVHLRKEFGVSLDNTSNIQLGKAMSKLGFEKVKRGGQLVYAIDKLDDTDNSLKVAS